MVRDAGTERQQITDRKNILPSIVEQKTIQPSHHGVLLFIAPSEPPTHQRHVMKTQRVNRVSESIFQSPVEPMHTALIFIANQVEVPIH